MEWKVLFSTFGTVFLAELGDKTQLATLSMAASGHSRWMVFLGSSLALVATSALATAGGDAIARFVSPLLIRRAAGILFVVLGILYLFQARGPT